MSMCGMPPCRHCGKPVQTTWGSAEWHAENDPIGGYCQCVSNEFRQLAEAAKAKLESDKYQHMREACEEYLRPKGNMQSREDFVVKSFERRGKYDRVCSPDAVLSALNELATLKEQNAMLTVQVQEGWKLVPVEPTDAMTYVGQQLRYDSANSIADLYRNMLAVSPAHPQQVKSEDARPLRAFAQDIMRCWPDGDVDGGYLQDAAEKHGLIAPETRHESCDNEFGAGRNCAGCYSRDEWEAGVTCYRKTPLLNGPSDAAISAQD